MIHIVRELITAAYYYKKNHIPIKFTNNFLKYFLICKKNMSNNVMSLL